MATNRGAFAAVLVLLLALTSPTKADAQNFPPIAKATPTTEETLLGQPILFSSTESIDPDEGPQPLRFLWDFGDGATSTNANPMHAYTNAGAYRVSLTVSDGADAAIDTVVVHVLAPPAATPPAKSSLLALNPAGTELWVANPDADSVSVLAVSSNSVTNGASTRTTRTACRPSPSRRARWLDGNLHPQPPVNGARL